MSEQSNVAALERLRDALAEVPEAKLENTLEILSIFIQGLNLAPKEEIWLTPKTKSSLA